LLCLTGCISTSRPEAAYPYPSHESPADVYPDVSPSAAINKEDISRYYGKPAAATLIVNQQEQRSGIGNTFWIESKAGEVTTHFYGDAFGVVTPAQPISVASPFTATLGLPVHIPPSRLGYVLYPVEEDDRWRSGDRQTRTWNPPGGPTTGLALETRQEIVFNVVTEGMHVLLVNAEWSDLGSVD
jgi:hypothetical protein